MKEILSNPQIMQQFVLFGILIFAMYFLILRPQKKKEKEINSMRNNIKVGDEIITIGGIYARVLKVKEESLIIQVGSDKTKMEVTKWAVSKVVKAADDAATKRAERDAEKMKDTPKKKGLPKKLGKSTEDKVEEASEEIVEPEELNEEAAENRQ